MDLDRIIKQTGAERSRQAMQRFVQRFLNPAFGALPKAEIELLVLDMLEDIGAVSPDAGIYELVSTLRVTRAKARKLIYERELRRLTPTELDARVKALLKRPLIQKHGEQFALEVENPLVSDHLRARLQQLGHISDGSFSPGIVKLSAAATSALMEDCIPEGERTAVRKALRAAGVPDASFQGMITAVLKKMAGKLASDTGEAMIDRASGYVSPLLDAATETIKAKVGELYRQARRGDRS